MRITSDMTRVAARTAAVLLLGISSLGAAAGTTTETPEYFYTSEYTIEPFSTEGFGQPIKNLFVFEFITEGFYPSGPFSAVPDEITKISVTPPYSSLEVRPALALLIGTQEKTDKCSTLDVVAAECKHIVLMVKVDSIMDGTKFRDLFSLDEATLFDALGAINSSSGVSESTTVSNFGFAAQRLGLLFELAPFPSGPGQSATTAAFDIVRFSDSKIIGSGSHTWTTNVPSPALPALLGLGLLGTAALRRQRAKG